MITILLNLGFFFKHNTHRIKKCLSLVKTKPKIQRNGGRGKKNFLWKVLMHVKAKGGEVGFKGDINNKWGGE
jgi:hypothetical protein